MKKQCERFKRILPNILEEPIDIMNLAEDKDFNIDIDRVDFEDICVDLFNKSISLIEKVLEDSNLTKNQIDEIILTRGSHRYIKN